MRPIYDALLAGTELRERMFTHVARRFLSNASFVSRYVPHLEEAASEIGRAFANALVYHTTNVYQLCREMGKGRSTADPLDAIVRGARVVVPHPYAWIETRALERDLDGHWAWLVWQTSPSPKGSSLAYQYAGVLLYSERTKDRGLGWTPCAVMTWQTVDDGTISCKKRLDGLYDIDWHWVPIDEGAVTKGGQQASPDSLLGLGVYLLFTLGFLNCRNIVQREWTPTRQMRRQAERSGERLPVTFRTIEVTRIGSSEVGRPKSDTHPGVALHIQRGHFKRYTEDRPLLGRFVGQFWWEQHTRGSAEHGISGHDYDIKTAGIR
jgi:hypothetical protein